MRDLAHAAPGLAPVHPADALLVALHRLPGHSQLHLLLRRSPQAVAQELIRHYLNAGIMANGVMQMRVEGTPQGGPLSPLLANVLLDEVDRELERRGHKFVRYADDCNAMSGCSTCNRACWISLSTTVGIPSSRVPPPGLGMLTRRTGLGR